MVMYGHNARVVDDLIKRKKEEGLWRENPDFPDNEEMILFYARGPKHGRTYVRNLWRTGQ